MSAVLGFRLSCACGESCDHDFPELWPLLRLLTTSVTHRGRTLVPARTLHDLVRAGSTDIGPADRLSVTPRPEARDIAGRPVTRAMAGTPDEIVQELLDLSFDSAMWPCVADDRGVVLCFWASCGPDAGTMPWSAIVECREEIRKMSAAGQVLVDDDPELSLIADRT